MTLMRTGRPMALFLAAPLAVLLAACGSSSSGAGAVDDCVVRVGAFASPSSHSAVAPASTAAAGALPPFWFLNVLTSYDLYNTSQALFEEAASTIGYEAFTAGSAKVDIPEQITLIEQAIAQGAKAIMYCDVDPPTYDKTVKDAQAKGIVMVTTGGCVDDYSDYSVGTDNATLGEVRCRHHRGAGGSGRQGGRVHD